MWNNVIYYRRPVGSHENSERQQQQHKSRSKIRQSQITQQAMNFGATLASGQCSAMGRSIFSAKISIFM